MTTDNSNAPRLAEAQRSPELKDVLDILDDWLAKQGGLQTLEFSYLNERSQRVSIRVENTRGKVMP